MLWDRRCKIALAKEGAAASCSTKSLAGQEQLDTGVWTGGTAGEQAAPLLYSYQHHSLAKAQAFYRVCSAAQPGHPADAVWGSTTTTPHHPEVKALQPAHTTELVQK